MNAKIEKKNLVITIPLCSPRPSASGKSLVIATTGGFAQTTATFDGKPVTIALNATIKP